MKMEFISKPTIEYIRTGPKPGIIFKLKEEERKKLLGEIKLDPPQRKKVGVFFAGVLKNQPNKVIVGFSLCNPLDDFDRANNYDGKKIKHLGLKKAVSFAIKNKDKKIAVEYNHPFIPNFDPDDVVVIPYSLFKKNSNIHTFINRIRKRYKDKELPVWCGYLGGSVVSTDFYCCSPSGCQCDEGQSKDCDCAEVP